MKRNDCSIVQDLLPLYIEEMLQPDTVEYVEDHLSGCEGCTDLLAELKSADSPAPDTKNSKDDRAVLKRLKKNLSFRHIALVLSGIIVVLHIFPWYDYPGTYRDPESAILYLFITLLPLYLTTALVFAEPLEIKRAAFASLLPLILALYAVWPFYKDFTVECTPTRTYYVFIGFCLALVVFAEYSIWYKAIKHKKED